MSIHEQLPGPREKIEEDIAKFFRDRPRRDSYDKIIAGSTNDTNMRSPLEIGFTSFPTTSDGILETGEPGTGTFPEPSANEDSISSANTGQEQENTTVSSDPAAIRTPVPESVLASGDPIETIDKAEPKTDTAMPPPPQIEFDAPAPMNEGLKRRGIFSPEESRKRHKPSPLELEFQNKMKQRQEQLALQKIKTQRAIEAAAKAEKERDMIYEKLWAEQLKKIELEMEAEKEREKAAEVSWTLSWLRCHIL